MRFGAILSPQTGFGQAGGDVIRMEGSDVIEVGFKSGRAMTARHRTVRLGAGLLLGVATLALTGCGSGGGIKNALGYGKSAPDEFAITTQAPLVIPPDFSLRPPAPGAPRPQDTQPGTTAQQAMFGSDGETIASTASSLGNVSPGEAALLTQTGAANASPDIRATVDNETRTLDTKSPSFTDQVLFWKEPVPVSGTMVDAPAEQKRIQENAAQGNPVTYGNTPIIEPRGDSWYSGLFNWF